MSTILFILLMFRLVGRYARDVPISIPWYLPNDEESYYHSEGAVLAPSYHFIAGATISPHYCVRLIATPYFRGSRASHDCYLAGATIIREWCAKRMPPLLPSWGIVSMEMLWLAIFGDYLKSCIVYPLTLYPQLNALYILLLCTFKYRAHSLKDVNITSILSFIILSLSLYSTTPLCLFPLLSLFPFVELADSDKNWILSSV